jgi:hypothetical protein
MSEVLRALARSPFVAGLARSFDLFGAHNEAPAYGGQGSVEHDAQAMSRDWQAVGFDLQEAITKLEGDHGAL